MPITITIFCERRGVRSRRVPLVGTGEHSEIENGRPAARRRLRLFLVFAVYFFRIVLI